MTFLFHISFISDGGDGGVGPAALVAREGRLVASMKAVKAEVTPHHWSLCAHFRHPLILFRPRTRAHRSEWQATAPSLDELTVEVARPLADLRPRSHDAGGEWLYPSLGGGVFH